MNPIKKALDGIAAALNYILPRQTGYVAPPPLVYVTRQGPRFDMDDPFVERVVKNEFIAEGYTFSSDPVRIMLAMRADRVGVNLNDRVTIVVDTGVGRVLYLATVELKEKSL